MIRVNSISGFLHLRKGELHKFFASLVLVVLMFIQLKAFILGFSQGSSVLAQWIYFFYLLLLFGLMMFSGKTARYRRIFFISFALLFFPSFIGNLLETRGSMALTAEHAANAEAPFCHMVIPVTLIPAVLAKTIIFPGRLTGHYAAVYSMLGIWLVASIMFGRGWCSWVCFYGGWDEGASRLAKKRRINLDKADPRIKSFNFVMLTFVVLVSLAAFSSVYCSWFCPFKLITEFPDVNNFNGYLGAIIYISIFVGIVIILPILTRKRVQCGLFCPFGAFQSLVGKISVFRLRRDLDKCSKCMACVTACPTLSISKELILSGKDTMSMTCTMCGECISVCKQGALSYDYRTKATDRLKKLNARIREKLEYSKTVLSGIVLVLVNTIAELLKPERLLPFTAFTFGMIISSTFAPHSIGMFLSWLSGGAL